MKLTSPNYPENYDPLEDCTWVITAPQGHYVTDAEKWLAVISLVLRHDFEEEKNLVDGVCSVPGELTFELEGFKINVASLP